MTGSAAAGGPPERRGPGHPGAWSAATDPVGQRPAAPVPGDEPGGAKPADRGPATGPPSRVPGSGAGSGREAGRPARSRRPDSGRPDSPGGELLTDMQRWLIRSSAKSMRREIEGQVRRTLGGGRGRPEDIWGAATTEPPPGAGESPECAWCPICRAARRMRESGPGLTSQLSGASDVVASAVQDAIGVFDAVLSRPATAPQQQSRADRSPDSSDSSDSPHSGRADSAGDKAERARDEPGDRS